MEAHRPFVERLASFRRSPTFDIVAMKFFFPTLALVLTAGFAKAQNADVNVVHGLPGLTAPVDVLVDGSIALAGVTFGETSSLSVAPGTYAVEIAQSGTVLLGQTITVAADESVTAAAHLLRGGAPTLSVFADDLSAVVSQGNGRLTVRHLADADFLYFAASNGLQQGLLSFIFQNGLEVDQELAANDYDVRAALFDPAADFDFDFPAGSPSTGLRTLAPDAGLIVNIVGSPGSPSFRLIVQEVSLEPSAPLLPFSCDLTVSGSLIGNAIRDGGDLSFDLTGAAPSSLAVVFFSLDNTPSTAFGRFDLDIGGASGSRILSIGGTDANGNFSTTLSFPALPPSGPAQVPAPQTIYTQVYTSNLFSPIFGTQRDCASDVESFTLLL